VSDDPNTSADDGATDPTPAPAPISTLPAEEQTGDRIEMVDLLTEMQRSYLDYSMAEIGRASCRERV